jgi:hypothetical protein
LFYHLDLELIERNVLKKDHENPMNGYDSLAVFVFNGCITAWWMDSSAKP